MSNKSKKNLIGLRVQRLVAVLKVDAKVAGIGGDELYPGAYSSMLVTRGPQG
jgi:hypothetical protein